MFKLRKVYCLLLLGLVCCKKPYNPPASSSANSYLVVEGVINLAVDSTVIKISRTVKLSDKIVVNPVLNATVTIEGEKNGATGLYDIANNGHYFNYDIAVSADQRYRLRIKTNDGSEYLSDYVDVIPTPPIDSIGYTIQNGTVNLYVNSHDPTNKARFYRWDYEETWIFHAKYDSEYIYNANTFSFDFRNVSQKIYYCFGTDVSSNIIINSTEKLAQDVVFQSPVTQIPLSSEKLESKYSILLKEYAISQSALAFYRNMQKTTEQLGSIFDAQPTQLNSNIHNISNPNEPVAGYITATNVQSKRIFIAHDDLPGNIQPLYPYTCEKDSAFFINSHKGNDVQSLLINPPVTYLPITGIPAPAGGGIIGYLYSTPECVDCTLRGTTQMPWYWK